MLAALWSASKRRSKSSPSSHRSGANSWGFTQFLDEWDVTYILETTLVCHSNISMILRTSYRAQKEIIGAIPDLPLLEP
jgi:hypothetical protein